ncbi:MAG TPA: helix-turn-helix transcriptional regulator [Verrucomicrobiae bacterium]
MNTKLNNNPNWPELAKQGNWSVSKLAKLCNISSRTLERYFLKEKKVSPKAWLLKQRHEQADKLLQNGLSVKETAANLDYKHSTHFSRGYKDYGGCCPTDKSATIARKNPECRTPVVNVVFWSLILLRVQVFNGLIKG